MEAPQKVIPFRSHSCEFIRLAHPHIKLYFKPSFTVCPTTKPHHLGELIFPDIHKNAVVFRPCCMMWNEWRLVEVYELLGASQVQVCFSGWEAVSSSFHTSTFGTFHTIWMGENKYKTWNRSQDGQKLRPCSNAVFWLKEMGPSLEPDPPCSFVTQVTGTLLADSCQRRLRRLQWGRWHPDCENFDATRLQEAPPNNHINGRQWA